eukprot:2409348-Rhodomonas_salina.1
MGGSTPKALDGDCSFLCDDLASHGLTACRAEGDGCNAFPLPCCSYIDSVTARLCNEHEPGSAQSNGWDCSYDETECVAQPQKIAERLCSHFGAPPVPPFWQGMVEACCVSGGSGGGGGVDVVGGSAVAGSRGAPSLRQCVIGWQEPPARTSPGPTPTALARPVLAPRAGRGLARAE